MALKTKLKYEKDTKQAIETRMDLFPHYNGIIPDLKFINSDMFADDWSNGSVIFTNSTCFSKSMMNDIFDKATNLSKGTIFINTTQQMPKNYLSQWQYVTPFQRLFSWGTCRIFIYRKRF
jgi:hypothetical protein